MAPLRAAFPPHCSSPSTPAPEVSGWHYSHRPHQGWKRVSLQTGGWADDCLVQSLQPGVKHSQYCGDDSGLQEEASCTPPTHYSGQHCGCSRVIQIPGNHHLPEPEVGQSHWLYCRGCIVQPATRAAETGLPCHHRVCPVFIFKCLVWSTKTDIRRLQRTVGTAERIIGAQPPRTLQLQSEEKGQESPSEPLTPSPLSLWTVALWPALQITEH